MQDRRPLIGDDLSSVSRDSNRYWNSPSSGCPHLERRGIMPVEAAADSRDMYAVHRVFRREFTNLPELIEAVADGDTRRAEVVAGHLEFLVVFLHPHHQGEDELVWPRLLSRGAAEISPLVHTMESQHH